MSSYEMMTLAEFCELNRTNRVAEIRKYDLLHGTTHAKGQSRARLETLEDIYKGLLEETPPGLSTEGAATGRLSSAEPNQGNPPRPAPTASSTVFLRHEQGVFFFIRPETGDPRRLTTDREQYLLARVKRLREDVGPVYVDRASGRRSNPTRSSKRELAGTLYKLHQLHGLTVVSDDAVKKMQEQQQPQAAEAQ